MHKLRSTVAALLVALAVLLTSTTFVQAGTLVVLVGTLAGSAGSSGSTNAIGSAARFSAPSSVALSADASVAIVADTQNHTLRKIVLATGQVTTLAGSAGSSGSTNAVGAAARFFHPEGVALSADGTNALVADTDNHTIRKVIVATGEVTTLAGSAGMPGSTNGLGAAARFSSPTGVAIAGGFALVADTGNHTIRRVDLSTGQTTPLAGSPGTPGDSNGVGTAAHFSSPRGVALDSAGSFALVADSGNHTIRKIIVATGEVTTLAGSSGLPGGADGTGIQAQFRFPRGVALSADGSVAMVADFSNSTIRRITLATRAVTTFAGSSGSRGAVDGVGSGARFSYPASVALSADGAIALVADTDNQTIRRLTLISVAPRVTLPLVTR
jgi:sugar lactone lactonase YvrE